MDYQWVLNGLFAVIAFLGGAVYNNIRTGMQEQDKELKELADKVHQIDKLVAGNYVHKDDLEKITAALFRKLDQICDKLDRKADKPHG